MDGTGLAWVLGQEKHSMGQEGKSRVGEISGLGRVSAPLEPILHVSCKSLQSCTPDQ